MDPSQEKRAIRLPLTEQRAGESVVTGITPEIIRAVVDAVDVREGADGRGTVVHMTKYLPD